MGAPAFVNGSFLATFPQGQLSAGTPVLAVVVPVSAPPPVSGAYSSEAWNAFVDTLLRPTEAVADCPGCWPAYTGTTIGVTTRWPEGEVLDVYVHSGAVEDRAALEAQLNEFQATLGVTWRYVATAAEADFHAFLGFDRLSPPATFPQWALDDLASQEQVPGWSAFATTSSSFFSGPNGIDPAERYGIDEAAIYVPFNQKSGELIPRYLLDTSIRHELVHGIGWGEHWSVPNRLMSPSTSMELTLSELEWEMLELLYEDDVLPGMYDQQILTAITVAP